jgi:hypothetical protein
MRDRQWRRGARAVLGGILLALAAPPAAAEHHVRVNWSGELGGGSDDTVGNAAEDADRRDSAVVSAGVNLDYVRTLTPSTALRLRGGLQGEGYEAHDKLSHGRLLAMARLSHRPTGGFYMPTFAGWLSAAAVEYGSAMRSGTELRAGAFVSEPLTTALSLRAGVAALERRADNAVFDLSHWSASLDLDWAVAAGFTLYAGYQFQDGDLVSTGSVPPKSSHISGGCGAASACDPDDALYNQFAYRIQGRTHVATLGGNVPLSPALALDAQVRRVEATAGENGYDRWQGVIGLLMRL